MPFIVTTKTPSALGAAAKRSRERAGLASPECIELRVSRRAVATLEERRVYDAKEWRAAGGDQPDGNERFWHNALILAKHLERPEAPGPVREELATVLFLHDGRVSHGHFTSMMRPAELIIPEAGGTVGSLPDGTVIEVKAVQWRTLCDLTGERYPGNDADRDRILDAFNARESA